MITAQEAQQISKFSFLKVLGDISDQIKNNSTNGINKLLFDLNEGHIKWLPLIIETLTKNGFKVSKHSWFEEQMLEITW